MLRVWVAVVIAWVFMYTVSCFFDMLFPRALHAIRIEFGFVGALQVSGVMAEWSDE